MSDFYIRNPLLVIIRLILRIKNALDAGSKLNNYQGSIDKMWQGMSS